MWDVAIVIKKKLDKRVENNKNNHSGREHDL
jgi:hypothetical protein